MGKGERNEEGGARRFGEEAQRNQPAGRTESLGKAAEGSEGRDQQKGPRRGRSGRWMSTEPSQAQQVRSRCSCGLGGSWSSARGGRRGAGAPGGVLAQGAEATVHVGS